MRMVRTALLTVAGGALMTFAVLMLGPNPVPTYHLGVGWVVTVPGGIDLWTGEVRPMTVRIPYGAGTSVKEVQWPEDYKNLRAIPIPVSFAAGSLLTLTAIALVGRRPRRTPSDSVVPAA
jgi:hypothetical protein